MSVRFLPTSGKTSNDATLLPQAGTIIKLVRLAAPNLNAESADVDGYGIIRSTDGHDVYFVNSAVRGCRFAELVIGQQVGFRLEESPFNRAGTVVPQPDGTAPAD